MLFIACRDSICSLLTVSCSLRVKMNSMLIVLKGILILEISVLVCTGSLLFEYMYVLYTVLLRKS